MIAGIVLTFAVTGFVFGLALGLTVGPFFGFPDMEGSAAIFAVLFAGPLGAAAGALGAAHLTRRYSAPEQRKKILTTVLYAIVALLVGSTVISMIRSRGQLSQSASTIAYEIRLPPGMPAPARKEDVSVELHSANDNRKAEIYDGLWLRDDNGRAVIRGRIEFFHVARDRAIRLRIGNGPMFLFKLRIAARPKSDRDFYGDWFAVDQVDERAGSPPRPPHAVEALDIRYFVTVPD
jgi:hypothetical protein